MDNRGRGCWIDIGNVSEPIIIQGNTSSDESEVRNLKKLPEYIKKAIRNSAKHNEIAKNTNNLVREWMHDNNLMNDANVDQVIDCIEIGNNPEALINYLQNDFVEGNSDDYKDSY